MKTNPHHHAQVMGHELGANLLEIKRIKVARSLTISK
jgi:hypothetical protein